ncbi:hypothetical protein HW555_006573 [Spodoptera exigua]|uniref:Uncharacterized protein n=1 Tax=Spodoptera exigua TaxID=7107 RepID=A0A835GED7_SPOEX|nr:hypothetical protein HW555_006573 [Spodoptera exigua]
MRKENIDPFVSDGGAKLRTVDQFDKDDEDAGQDFGETETDEETDMDNEETGPKEDNNDNENSDTFTPWELLPVTKMLLSQVRNPGENDLQGLDALQALSLDNTAVQDTRSGLPDTGVTVHPVNFMGQIVDVKDEPRSCYFHLLLKKSSPSKITTTKPVLRSENRRPAVTPPAGTILKLEKNMKPNRHLIINHRGRKSNKDGKHLQKQPDNKDVNKNSKQSKDSKKTLNKVNTSTTEKSKKKSERNSIKERNGEENGGVLTTTIKPVCTWRYVCDYLTDIDSCRLQTLCHNDGKNSTNFHDNVGTLKDKEQNVLDMKFRKMMGISILDEEVEKIIERRIVLTNPLAFSNNAIEERVETLEEYFNKILMHQAAQTSSPKPHILGFGEPNEKQDAGEDSARPVDAAEEDDDKSTNESPVRTKQKEEKKVILNVPVVSST